MKPTAKATKFKGLSIDHIESSSISDLKKLSTKVKDINKIYFLCVSSSSNNEITSNTKKVSFILYRNNPTRDFLKIKVTIFVNCENNNVTEEDMYAFIMNQLNNTGNLHLCVNHMIESFIKYFR